MIAIIIPTINRTYYLQKALNYYAKVGFTGKIYIGDSSKDNSTYDLVKQARNELDIYYWPVSAAIHDAEVVQSLNQHLAQNVKYVAFAGDDDFLIPSGLYKCAEFLDNNPSYVAAHGHRINFTIDNKKPILLGAHYGYNWNNTTTPFERWREYISVGISIANYLHRKDLWLKRYEYAHKTLSRYLGPELLPESLTALSGPVKYLTDCITYFFYSNNPDRVFSFTKTDLYDLMLKPEWGESLNVIHTVLSQYLEPRHIKKYLWKHFITIMLNQYNIYGTDKDVIRYNQLLNDVEYPKVTQEFNIIRGIL
jgi:glycosyltransferase domain-containing protein